MKILYVTTIGTTMIFFKRLIEELVMSGHSVDIACNDSEYKVHEFYGSLGCKIHTIHTSRSPLSKGNLTAISEIKKLVENEKYDIVHCHTPVAAMCTRLACRKLRKEGTKVVYTAHGFHFYKGAPLKNWLIFYPIEKLCSYYTDTLITINKDDFALAKKKMKAKQIEYVPGVGIDVEKINGTDVDRGVKRKEIGVPQDAFMFASVGELNENKNHAMIIKALGEINNENIHFVVAGMGSLKESLEKLAAEYKISEQVHLLGYRTDVYELLKVSDGYIHPSFREGLPVSVMEALASGLPIICSKIRGNIDIVEDGKNGLHFDVNNVEALKEAILKIYGERNNRIIGIDNSKTAEKFDVSAVNKKMYELYFGKDEK